MRALFRFRIVATIAFMSAASAPARAQTYDPDYPICAQIYGRSSRFDCQYASLEQCRSLAVSGSTSCVD